MNRINDKLYANDLVINLKQISKEDNSKEPVLYTATGNVHLEIVTPIRHYIATGDKVIKAVTKTISDFNLESSLNCVDIASWYA